MFADIHHSHRLTKDRHQHALLLAALLIVIGIVATVGLTRRLSAGANAAATVQVEQPLDIVGFGSARHLLIASLEPISHPVQSCSPFGSLTACASNHFAGFLTIDVHAPV